MPGLHSDKRGALSLPTLLDHAQGNSQIELHITLCVVPGHSNILCCTSLAWYSLPYITHLQPLQWAYQRRSHEQVRDPCVVERARETGRQAYATHHTFACFPGALICQRGKAYLGRTRTLIWRIHAKGIIGRLGCSSLRLFCSCQEVCGPFGACFGLKGPH